jgi:CreA protein
MLTCAWFRTLGWQRVTAPLVLCAALLTLGSCGPDSDEVGEFSNDWFGNEIKIEAVRDPEVPGVVCHFTHFDRGLWDRLSKGKWFEDPSNASITCLRNGDIDLSGATLGKGGEEVFSQRNSLFFKKVAVRRIVDLDNRALLYVAHSRQIVNGSAKMSLSAVPLTETEAASARPR